MLEDLKKISNQITLVRIFLLPFMWLLILKDYPLYYVGILLIICGVTDVLDGYLARKLNQLTDLGSRMDSWADNILLISAILWTALRLPEVFTENSFLMFTALGFYGTFLLVGAVKFRRFANLHLYLSKAASLIAYLFLVHALLTGSYSRGFFILTASVSILSNTEGIAALLILSQVDEHMGSLVFLYLKEESPLVLWIKRVFRDK